MNWDMLGAVGEIISAIAVVASLIYLARQIQHTRRAYVVESVEVAAMKTIDFATAIAADSDLADLMMRVQAEGESRANLTRAERGQVAYLYFAIVLIQWGFFERWRNGLISRETLEQNAAQATGLLAAPYFREVWPIIGPNYSAAFRTWIEERFDLEALPRAESAP